MGSSLNPWQCGEEGVMELTEGEGHVMVDEASREREREGGREKLCRECRERRRTKSRGEPSITTPSSGYSLSLSLFLSSLPFSSIRCFLR